MSAVSHELHAGPDPESHHDSGPLSVGPHEDPRRDADGVVVRRNAGLAALIGAGASAIAIAYLWRATDSGAVLDWALCLVMGVIAAYYLASLLDARTPLLVADQLGVRIRLGNQWRGLPWDAVDRVVVEPRRRLATDGRLMLAPRSLGRALEGLDTRGRRHAQRNQQAYGAALAVPLGLTTRVSWGTATGDRHGSRLDGAANLVEMADELAMLARGRADIVVKETEPSPAPAPEATYEAIPEAIPGAIPEATPAPVASTTRDASSEAVPAPDPDRRPEPVLTRTASDTPDVSGPPRRSLLGGLATVVSRVSKPRPAALESAADDPVLALRAEDTDHTGTGIGTGTGTGTGIGIGTGTGIDGVEGVEGDGHPDDLEQVGEPHLPAPRRSPDLAPSPLRETRRATRAQVTRDEPATVLGNAALLPDHEGRERRTPLPEGRELRRDGSVDLEYEGAGVGRVRPISTLGDPVEPLVIDDFVTEPAYDPVIGPELAAARTRVGLSVDELAERTRIRPHVIESIEVDDFAPCGGDFYARGHLRTLGRTLGKDPAILIRQFDERYATAPINARRVFEAELATGMTGSMRSTSGGPNWAMLVGVVVVLAVIWGAARIFDTQPAEILRVPAPIVNSNAGQRPAAPTVAAPVPPSSRPWTLRLVATQSGSHVVVRGRNGAVAYEGDLLLGATRTVRAVPPVKITASNAGAVEVRAGAVDKGAVGSLGASGTRTFDRGPAR